MNITSPILAGAADMAELPGDSVASLLKMVGTAAGPFRPPKAALTAIADTQVELRIDRNSKACANAGRAGDPLSRALSINASAAASRFKQPFKQAFKQSLRNFGSSGRWRLQFHYFVADKDIIGAGRNIA
jgi:hypothetical protein